MKPAEFSWDESKSRSNQEKHGVSFGVAARVFDDPLAVSAQDRIIDGEVRWQTIGEVLGQVLLIVAHTYLADDGIEYIRIISSRKATKHERKRYENS